jgi:hypothetical protein
MVGFRPQNEHCRKLFNETLLAYLASLALLPFHARAQVKDSTLLGYGANKKRAAISAPNEFSPLDFHVSMDDATTREVQTRLKGDEDANKSSSLLPHFPLRLMMCLHDLRPCLEN